MANILGIILNELTEIAVLKKIDDFLNSSEQYYIVTPNPEIILEAGRDEEFFYILNKADLSLADGFGLKIAGWIYGKNIPRITGSDLTIKLLERSEKQGTKIIVLNWENGLSSAEEINSALTKKYPKLTFLILNVSRDKFLTPELIEKINNFGGKILFSALGFPYQEKVIYHNLNKLPSIKVALGIGGSFDFITEKIKRAPKMIRSLGLEWLWRLIKQPTGKLKRLKRIYRATFVFLAKIFRARFLSPFLYRPNVACILYKKENNLNGEKALKILLVEREDDHDHWQLPQGGRDGQDTATAGSRELLEEIGTDKFSARGVFKNVYRYKFGSINTTNLKTGIDIIDTKKYKFDYKGQKQDLFIAEFLGLDSDLKVCFWDHVAWKWVVADQLAEEVHAVRKRAAKIFLEKFKSLNL